MDSPSFLKFFQNSFANRPLAIFDRDGTLNYDHHSYTHRLEDFELISGVIPALKILSENKINIAIATNQSGIGRGLFSSNDFLAFNGLLIRSLKSFDISVQAIAACFHTPEDKCECRKPKPLMIQAIIRGVQNDHRVAFFGDSGSDLLTAQNAGVGGFIVVNGNLTKMVQNWVESLGDL